MEKLNDAQKLNGLADLLENLFVNDPYCEYDNRGIQKDLREMAEKINALGGNIPVFHPVKPNEYSVTVVSEEENLDK